MIVLGLGFGDEGKGRTTSFLCSQTENPLVVRFNGGHQAGHTVVHNGKRHVFSSFGSGSLQDVPTYWSKYCTFYPPSFLREYEKLDEPRIFVDPLCPVTTPFDIEYNRKTELKNRHGSVGMGFGATMERQEDNYKLFVQDLFYEKVLISKLKAIANYYFAQNVAYEIQNFLKDVDKVKNIIGLWDDSVIKTFTPIFEGAQGILLDQDFGFFPNVTRSNTTSKNALEIYPSAKEVYYVTRTYATRHGNGFFPNEVKLDLINNENETNKEHPYQGKFRTANLHADLLNYALRSDNNFSKGLRKNLVITCMDQYKINVTDLLDKLEFKFENVFVTSGETITDVIQIK